MSLGSYWTVHVPLRASSSWIWNTPGNPLSWRHMFFKTSQTTDNSTAFFNRFSPSQQRKHQRTAWLVLCKWNTTDGLPSHRVNNAESVSMSWPYTLYDSEDENITHVLYCCVFSGINMISLFDCYAIWLKQIQIFVFSSEIFRLMVLQ